MISHYELMERSIPEWFGAEPFDKQQFLKNNKKIFERRGLLTTTLASFDTATQITYFDLEGRVSNKFIKTTPNLLEFGGKKIIDLRDEFDAVLLLTHPGVNIYGHWLIDIAPVLSMFECFFQDLSYAVAIPDGSPDWVLNLLNNLPFKFKQVMRVGVEEVVFGNLFFSTELRIHDYLSSFISKCYLKFSAKAIGDSKLYISRQGLGAGYRQLINCEEVERLFESRGFELYRPEAETIEAQIEKFAGVRFLAGEAGSGMHNSLFCPSASKVINIQSSRQNHFIQAGLCRQVGQECTYVFGHAESDDWNAAFSVDLNALEAALNVLGL